MQGDEGELKGRAEHKEDWKGKWALLYQSGKESLEKSGAGTDGHLNDEAILDQLSGQEDFHAEWLEFQSQTMESIMRLNLGDMMEIGCGTGQVLLRVAPHAKSYYGTDFAELGIQEIERHIKAGKEDLSRVRVAVKEGVDFSGVNPRSLDTVVINSVIQYFPDAPYLMRVIENAVDALRPGGCIYLGDVQSYAHLFTHHVNNQLARSNPSLDTEKLRRLVDARVLNEDELVVDPEFFHGLLSAFPRLSRVELKHRRGRSRTRPPVITTMRTCSWNQTRPRRASRSSATRAPMLLRNLRVTWSRTKPDLVCLHSVPNSRVTREVFAAELLRKPGGPGTVSELNQALGQAEAGVDPEAFWALGESLPYEVDVLWTPGREASFDLVLRRKGADGKPVGLLPSRLQAQSIQGSVTRFANSPHLKGLAKSPCTSQGVRRHQAARVHGALAVGAARISCRSRPTVSSTGVRYRRPRTPVRVADSFVAPTTETEKAVAAVWAEVLRLEQVSVNDNFFELGGHSLLAVQVVMRMREVLSVDIALGTVFTAPTVATLSRAVDAAKTVQGAETREPQADLEEMVF